MLSDLVFPIIPQLYEAAGVSRERVLIKLAGTWEGIRCAEALERDGIKTNITLVFGVCQAVAAAQVGLWGVPGSGGCPGGTHLIQVRTSSPALLFLFPIFTLECKCQLCNPYQLMMHRPDAPSSPRSPDECLSGPRRTIQRGRSASSPRMTREWWPAGKCESLKE